MNAFTALVRKDLVLYFSNRRALIMSIAAPVLIAAFFGSLFGNTSSKPAHIEVAITDLDQSRVSRQIVDAMRADSTLTVTEMTEAQAETLVKSGKNSAAVTLPQGFGKQAGSAMFGGTAKPEIGLRYDPSQSITLQVVRGLIAQHVMQAVSSNVFNQDSDVFTDLRQQVQGNTDMPVEQRNQLIAMFDSIAKVQAAAPAPAASGASAPSQAGGGFTTPYTTREIEAVGSGPARKYNSYSHSFAGMGVQFVLLMGVDIGVALLMMRRLGLWKRLRAAPLSRADLLGSRIASCALISLVSMAAIYVIAMLGFGVRIDGSMTGFIAVLVAFALMTASFGLLIAAIGKTPEVTRGLAILVTLLMVMLGGAWVPAFIFPEWLQTVSLAMPTRWAVDGLDAMTWRGLPIESAILPVVVQLGFAAVFSALALWRFEWDE